MTMMWPLMVEGKGVDPRTSVAEVEAFVRAAATGQAGP
jgi:hypothetical protein